MEIFFVNFIFKKTNMYLSQILRSVWMMSNFYTPICKIVTEKNTIYDIYVCIYKSKCMYLETSTTYIVE
jgi:hypothetical protein